MGLDPILSNAVSTGIPANLNKSEYDKSARTIVFTGKDLFHAKPIPELENRLNHRR